MRILHTGDWQIGMNAAHAGGAAARLREARFEAAARVIAAAAERHVDAVLLAGDTFEHHGVARGDIQRVVDILRGSPAPVFVLPGNHDPLVPGSVFEHPAFADARAVVTVISRPCVIPVGDGEIVASPLTAKESEDDPTTVFPPPPAGTPRRVRIGLAHGSLRGAGAADADISFDFPIDRIVVSTCDLDYLALGHWHSASFHEVDGVVRVAYAGTPEPTRFGETGSGGALLVTIPAPGAPPVIETLPVAVLRWRDEDLSLSAEDDVRSLRSSIDRESPAEGRRTLLRIALSGVTDPRRFRDLDDLEDLGRQRFLHFRLDRTTLAVEPSDASWIADLPEGPPRRVAASLLARAAGQDPGGAALAREALRLLFEAARETGS